jgi:hypothetical protein
MDKRKAKILPSGQGHNELTKQYPKVSGFLESMLTGSAPDELSDASVLDPLTADRQAGARAGFPLGIAAQVAPLLGPLSKVAQMPGPVSGGRAAQRGVIKMKGGNWLSGSVEDSLKSLKGYHPVPSVLEPYEGGRFLDQTSGEIFTAAQAEGMKAPRAVNSFIDKQLTRYIKNEMATPTDPIRALAERGTLHVNPEELLSPGRMVHPSGDGPQKLAVSDLARRWENTSDAVIDTPDHSNLTEYFGKREAERVASANPWLGKLGPTDKVHSISPLMTEGQDLGFRHLIDELRNATDPASGLPAHLQLRPESLDRVSMPQAVEHVAKINAWRQEQKVAADAAKANNAATVLHKDYGDKGFKWVELKAPKRELPPGFTVEKRGEGALGTHAVVGDGTSWSADSEQEAIDRFFRHRPEYSDKTLKDALKYEGDTMGHCVGGYCDDVASGRSRIFSLRDSKTGEPHVTIETAPDYGKYGGESNTGRPDRIVQIKGKGNAAPADRYKPFAQDFVKSGQWADVGDLQNTGLVKFRGGKTNIREGGQNYGENLDMPSGYMTPREASQFLEAQGVPTIQARRHVGDYQGLLDLPTTPRPEEPNFAQGGRVQPTEAQAAAGNYKKDHVWAHGLNISIENPADSVRSGKSKDGDEWHTRMQHDYGYIRGTKGADKDHVDVFLGPDYKDRTVPVHVIDQHDTDGKFDEHKVMMGFKTPEEAKAAYHGNYRNGWDGAKAVTAMHVDDFKEWVTDSKNTTKPAAQSFAGGGAVTTSQVDRDRQQRLQNEHSTQVMKQMARGWLAGTVGMPGDLEGLARSLIPGVSNTPFLPTSDFYKEWLPGASEDPRLQAAADVASYAGGLGVGAPLKAAGKLVEKAGAPLVRHAGNILNAGMHGEGALAKVLAPAQPAFAVKPKGGNWTEMIEHDPVQAMDLYEIGSSNTAPNNWRDKQLMNYIRNQMGTADDPLLKLEQEGRLHMTPDQMELNAQEYGAAPYPSAGDGNTAYRIRPNSSKADKFHYETTGRNYRTPWENLSDNAIRTHTPGEEVNWHLGSTGASPETNTIGGAIDELSGITGIKPEEAAGINSEVEYLKRRQWLDKTDPKTKIYGLGDPQGLGFQHMMDYMGQANDAGIAFEHHGSIEAMRAAAANAQPNAPIHDFIPLVERNLHLTDADIARSSVSDIAAKTGEWNKILEQTKTLRAQTNVPTHKTYDSGHSWKAVPDTATNDDALNFCMGAGKDAGWCTQVNRLAQHYGGNGNQLYILHDAAGKPKVQIAVKPPKFTEQSDAPFKNAQDMAPEEINAIFDHFGSSDINRRYTLAQNWKWNPEAKQWMDKESLTPSIQEIKGRRNGRPDPEDMAAVQDFVKSGNWGKIGDMQNTGLRKTSDVWNNSELDHMMGKGVKPGEYHTVEEIKAMNDQVWPDNSGEIKGWPNQDFAKGGHVTGLINVDTYEHKEQIPDHVIKALVKRFGPHLTMRSVLDTFKKEANGGHSYATKKKLVDWAMSHV